MRGSSFRVVRHRRVDPELVQPRPRGSERQSKSGSAQPGSGQGDGVARSALWICLWAGGDPDDRSDDHQGGGDLRRTGVGAQLILIAQGRRTARGVKNRAKFEKNVPCRLRAFPLGET
jgi:hypothetical protein